MTVYPPHLDTLAPARVAFAHCDAPSPAPSSCPAHPCLGEKNGPSRYCPSRCSSGETPVRTRPERPLCRVGAHFRPHDAACVFARLLGAAALHDGVPGHRHDWRGRDGGNATHQQRRRLDGRRRHHRPRPAPARPHPGRKHWPDGLWVPDHRRLSQLLCHPDCAGVCRRRGVRLAPAGARHPVAAVPGTARLLHLVAPLRRQRRRDRRARRVRPAAWDHCLAGGPLGCLPHGRSVWPSSS